MKAKCNNCNWEGEILGSPIIGNLGEEQWFCRKCGDTVKIVSEKPSKDLNRDGKVDDKDTSLAAKVLRGARRKKKTPATPKKRKTTRRGKKGWLR